MKIDGPDELMGLFFKYGIQQLPVVKEGQVRGTINKPDLVRQLRKTDHFGRNVVKLLEQLLEPAERDILSRLREKLKEDEINGIPIINFSGEVQRVITPGILQTEEKSEQYLDEATQRSLYEEMFELFPFPIKVQANGQRIFVNELYDEDKQANSDWDTIEFEREKYSVIIYLPTVVLELNRSFKSLSEGEEINLRELLDRVESELLTTAQANADSVSEAADLVGLPRQTFTYRQNNTGEHN